jgi:hypothetical protein
LSIEEDKMKKLFCLYCFLFLVFSPFVLEGSEEEPDEYTLKGKTGILFNFNGLNLNPYEGGIGIKKGISRSTALIASLQFSYYKDEEEVTDEMSGSEYRNSSIGIMFGFEKHLKQIKRISPYLGVSLLIRQGKYYYKYTQPLSWGSYYSITDQSTLFLNPMLFMGFEIKITNNVYLAGQYALGYEYGFGTSKDETPSSSEKQDLKITTAGADASSVILIIYF